MINNRIIKIKNHYKWMYIIITIVMCLISIKVLDINTSIAYVQAESIGESDNLVSINKNESDKSKLFLLILNKTIPAMEVNYILEYGDEIYPKFYKLALGKVIKFNYQDPRSLLRAQLPALVEVSNDDLAEEGYEFSLNQESIPNNGDRESFIVNKDTVEEYNRIIEAENENIETSTTLEDPISKNPSSNITVVSSPIKMPEKVSLSTSEPNILIYHTHGTESYLPETVGNFHSLNEEFTVRAVGEQLSKQLQDKGFKVIHDKTLHDYPSYNQSYIRGLETLSTNLEKNSSLKIILDIHRDAAPENDEAREDSYVTINGERVAKYAMVVGNDNKNAEELMTFAEYIKAISDELYPGLARKTIIKEFRFNQYNSDYYALVEVGNTANHIDEAIRTANYLSEILEKVINNIRK